MSFNPAPTGYFPNINVGEVVSGVTGVFIPWSDLEAFDTSTSGDVRQLAYSFNQGMYNGYSGLATADKPDEMTIRLSKTFPTPAKIRNTYTSIFNLDFASELVMTPEPTG
jgi:hypothetical protein